MKPDISSHRLMLITDRHRSLDRKTSDIVREALVGGVRLFQLREPDLSRDDIRNLAAGTLPLVREKNGVLILNDWIDVCEDIDADGVHLGANDPKISYARSVLGESKLIGFSAHTREQARMAADEGADYITLSPAFRLTHKESPYDPHSADELHEIADSVGIPVFFLGGIDAENIGTLKKTGSITRVAMVSAITKMTDIQTASRLMLDILNDEIP